jgi:hypothetical protein
MIKAIISDLDDTLAGILKMIRWAATATVDAMIDRVLLQAK